MIKQQFTQPLLVWHDKHGRKDLPWQKPRAPYFVWLSEIMLQQTQVKTVIPYFHRFIEHFPTLEKLASSTLDDVLVLWSGLGYYSRARNLHKCAQIILSEHQGNFPTSNQILTTLPGIGKSTASAITSLAFNQPTAILDGNVKRVLCRYFGIDLPINYKDVEKKLWTLAQYCMDDYRCAEYTQAIMDFGATCCTRAKPNCTLCPLQNHCHAYSTKTAHKIPVKLNKKEKPTREGHFILLQKLSGAIFLKKNDLKGIWGGLWCLPYFNTVEDSIQWLEERWKLKLQKTKFIFDFKHTFTHFRLHLKVYHYEICVSLPGDIKNERWLTIGELNAVGLPKPITQILKHFWA